jgi:hypothetical protein
MVYGNHTCLLTDQNACQIVPNTVTIHVDPTIQCAVGNQTNVESRRTKRSKLRPTWFEIWQARNPNYCILDVGAR